MIERVKKRNGRIEKFSRQKILRSIRISLHMMGKESLKLEEKITDDVINRLKTKKSVDTEDIRKSVCSALRKNKHHDVCDFYSLVWLHAKPVKIRYVIKRHGGKEKFSPEKLFKSVQKSFNHAHVKDGKRLQDTVNHIFLLLNKKYSNKDIETTEIKDIVEYVLVKRKLDNVAKHYIMYRYM